MNWLIRISGILVVVGTTASIQRSGPTLPSDVRAEYDRIQTKLDYNSDVKPILSDKCFACHGPDKAKQQAGLRLDKAEAAFALLPENPGKRAIVPKNINTSEAVRRILSKDPEEVMPTPASHLTLSAREKAVIIRWIEQGAVYQPHWAFVAPKKTTLPDIPDVENPIDRFIYDRLRRQGITPTPTAPRDLWLRRVSLDLTGLPPTPSETAAFLQDTALNAYERQVDRLLNSPHYGERMAADWLDIARFADSHGYTVDRLRDMSPYRDWVIKAFNQNMRYDRFIHEQLAGDLMPKPTRDMLIATAFNRNHPQNMEGGIVEEEFQTEYVADRTNTFGEAFMAMSLGCARCHDHKYDPISQQNYFEVYGFFNNVLEAGQISFNDDIPTPALPLPTPAQEKTLEWLKENIATSEKNLEQAKLDAASKADEWMKAGGSLKMSAGGIPTAGLESYHRFDGNLWNDTDTSRKGNMEHDWGAKGDIPVFTRGYRDSALQLNGDVYLNMPYTGIFRKSQPFTIGLRVWIPSSLKEGVIFHKSDAERLWNYKGYSLTVTNGKIKMIIAHTAPSNAIIRQTINNIPRDRWIHLTMTWDGSSRADGLNLYADGQPLALETQKDKLYKDILFGKEKEPGLQIGGWYRGSGFTGGKVDDLTVHRRHLTPFEISLLAGKVEGKDVVATQTRTTTSASKDILTAYYVEAVDTSVQSAAKTLMLWRNRLADTMRHVKEIMVMEEMPVPKKTYLLERGRYDMPGREVKPATPADILPFPAHLPRNRYGLAQWLTHHDHPLTARVAVNRIWQQFFGTGLVKTSEDFGNQGEIPRYRELLDWLAVEFRTSGWDMRHIIKLIVSSDAYRRSSQATPAQREADPENRWLGRGPAVRLTAEMLRDNALFASGLLRTDIGGRSIKPYQPAGLWEINSASYQADTTDVIYKRSLYIVTKRTVPHPTLAMFDASDRSACLSRRQQTNTPLQALALLNDPAYVEAYRKIGEQMTKASDVTSGISDAYRRLTGVSPQPEALQLLESLYKRTLERFRSNPEKAKGWLKTGRASMDPSLDQMRIAANAVVASTIMNSDAAITKR
jgi:hypothetical protein